MRPPFDIINRSIINRPIHRSDWRVQIRQESSNLAFSFDDLKNWTLTWSNIVKSKAFFSILSTNFWIQKKKNDFHRRGKKKELELGIVESGKSDASGEMR